MHEPNTNGFYPVDAVSEGRLSFGVPLWTATKGVDSQRPVRNSLREVDPGCPEDLRELARLHMKLLGHGPLAQLGEFFIRRFCYTVLIEEGLLRAALFEIEGRPAGFVAYTPWSITFHRSAIRKHWLYVGFLVAVSFLRDPRILPRLIKAMKLMASRRSEITLGSDPMGELVCIGVLPEFRTPGFVRQTGLRISQELVEYAASYFRRAGLDTMRMIVEASNKPALLFYNSLGARFEDYEQMGEPMIHVRFDLERRFDVAVPDIPERWCSDANARKDDSNNEWQAYWDGLEDLPEFFRAEAADFVKRLDDVVSLGADARVLDFGCGFGYVADLLAPRVGEICLWDFSWNMRRQARLVTAQHHNIGFVDLSEPTLQSDLCFDLIIVNSVSQYMSDEEFSMWLSCWQRLLKPDGRLVLSDLIPPGATSAAECADFIAFSARHGLLMKALKKGVAEIRRYPKAKLSLRLRPVSNVDLLQKATEAGMSVEFLPSNLTHRRGRTAAVLKKANVELRIEN